MSKETSYSVKRDVLKCQKRPLTRALTFDGTLNSQGNLPFRRLCKTLGCDVTYGEMALAAKIVEGIHMYIYIYVWVCVCVCVCIHMYICIYI